METWHFLHRNMEIIVSFLQPIALITQHVMTRHVQSMCKEKQYTGKWSISALCSNLSTLLVGVRV
jgi:hypothetical protein